MHANIEATTVNERTLAMEHFPQFKKKDLIVFDSSCLSKIAHTVPDRKQILFLIRTQKSFSQEIDNMDKEDFCVTIHACKCRVIKVVLDTGEAEVLVTNLGQKRFCPSDFKAL